MRVRAGDSDDLVAVMRLLDAGLLETDVDDVRDALAAGRVLVADADARVVGALVLDRNETSRGAYVAAVAVHPSRRGRGVGTALVEAAADREGTLTADFDRNVRPFYESLGFDVEERDGRLRGVR